MMISCMTRVSEHSMDRLCINFGLMDSVCFDEGKPLQWISQQQLNLADLPGNVNEVGPVQSESSD